jgi:phosphohistidine phosphatase SixA
MTRSASIFVSCCLLLAMGFAPKADAALEDSALWQAVARGGHVLLIRHARAPGGGDPAGFRLEDCATQRNLNSDGQDQARRIGDAFRRAGITRAQVFSSRWCRCLETGQLLALGQVTPLPALDSFFSNAEREHAQSSETLAWIKAADLSTPLVLVTHQVNITALTGIFPESGEIIVTRAMPDGTLHVVGRLRQD